MNITDYTAEKVSSMLKKRYITALLIIAVLVVATQAVGQSMIQKQIHDSRVINLAGKQRMLSQKISKDALGIYSAASPAEAAAFAKEMAEALPLWKRTHIGLQNGDSGLGLPGSNSPAVQELFNSIQPYHDAMLAHAGTVLKLEQAHSTDRAALRAAVSGIRENEVRFLSGMDMIVFQYDDEARAKVNRMRQLEIALMCFTLFTLVLEALFIFRPAQRLVRQSIRYLSVNEEQLRKLFDIAPTPLFLVEAGTMSIARLNQGAAEMLGVSFEEALNHKMYDFIEGKYLQPLAETAQEHIHEHSVEVVFRNINNESFYTLMSHSRLFFNDANVFLMGFSDISAQKQSEASLKVLASADDMTGLLNRRAGMMLLDKEIERAKRHGSDLVIAFVDLDKLKDVNDRYGHLEGDWFIKTVATALLNSIRAEDTAFRFGGDEMVLVFSDATPDQVREVLARAAEECILAERQSSKPYHVEFSCGFASWESCGYPNSNDLIHIADQQMYLEKTAKRSR